MLGIVLGDHGGRSRLLERSVTLLTPLLAVVVSMELAVGVSITVEVGVE